MLYSLYINPHEVDRSFVVSLRNAFFNLQKKQKQKQTFNSINNKNTAYYGITLYFFHVCSQQYYCITHRINVIMCDGNVTICRNAFPQ